MLFRQLSLTNEFLLVKEDVLQIQGSMTVAQFSTAVLTYGRKDRPTIVYLKIK